MGFILEIDPLKVGFLIDCQFALYMSTISEFSQSSVDGKWTYHTHAYHKYLCQIDEIDQFDSYQSDNSFRFSNIFRTLFGTSVKKSITKQNSCETKFEAQEEKIDVLNSLPAPLLVQQQYVS